MSRVLLTGANGFVGLVLGPLLRSEHFHVVALTGPQGCMPAYAHEHLPCDIRDAEALAQAVRMARPDYVVHLAAQANVASSFQDQARTWQANLVGSLNLLDALQRHARDAFVLLASSSEVYGDSFKLGVPLDEGVRCQPLNPYAASKLAAEVVFNEYFRQGMRGVIARPFNHIGAGQSESFAMASFARQIALIEAGQQPPVLKVGNLDACRDFLDVRDVCRAYLSLLQLGARRGEYSRCFNIASGASQRMRHMLDRLLAESALEIQVEQDPVRMRPSDIPVALGDSARLCRETPWRPVFSLDETCRTILDDWRARIAQA